MVSGPTMDPRPPWGSHPRESPPHAPLASKLPHRLERPRKEDRPVGHGRPRSRGDLASEGTGEGLIVMASIKKDNVQGFICLTPILRLHLLHVNSSASHRFFDYIFYMSIHRPHGFTDSSPTLYSLCVLRLSHEVAATCREAFRDVLRCRVKRPAVQETLSYNERD